MARAMIHLFSLQRSAMNAEASDNARLSTVWKLAWPNIVSNLCYSLVNIGHIKIVAALGTAAVAAVTTNQRFFFFLMAVLMGLSTAVTSTVARSWGAKRYADAAQYTINAQWIAILIAGLLSIIVFIFPVQIVSPFGLEPEAAHYAAEIIRWISIFNVLFAIGLILTAAMRAAGDVISPMLYTVVLSFANIVLVFSLSFGYLGLPNLGIYGVPWGVGLATAIVNVVLIWLWLNNRFTLKANWRQGYDRDKTRELLRLGLPSAIEQGIVQLGFLVFLALVADYGTAPYAAYGIGVSLLTVSIVVGFGFSIAGATMVGQLLGAKQYEAARTSGWRATYLAVVSMTVFGALIALNAEAITRFMVDDDAVVSHTVTFIYILAAAHPLMAIEFTLAGALRGAGDTRFPLISTLAGLVFGRIGLALLFIAMDLSVTWVYTALAADYVIKACLILMRYRSGVWLK